MQLQPAAPEYKRDQFGEIIETLEHHQFEGVREPVTVRIERDARNVFAVIDLPNLTRAGGGVDKKEALGSLQKILLQAQKSADNVTFASDDTKQHVIAIAGTPQNPEHPTTPAEAA